MLQQSVHPNVWDVSDIAVMTVAPDTSAATLLAGEEAQLLFAAEGRALIQTAGASEWLEPGELYMVPAGSGILQVEPVMETTVVYAIAYAGAYTERHGDTWHVQAAAVPYAGKCRMHALSIACHQMERIVAAWNTAPRDEMLVRLRFAEWMYAVQSAWSQQEQQVKPQSVLRAIQTHIDQHYTEPFQIEEMARFSGMTASVFYQSFKDDTSLTPLQYITSKRMEKARELLALENGKIGDIAAHVGYPDVAYFSRMFKKTAGVSPRTYAQAMRHKIAVLHPAFWGNLLALGVPPQQLIPLWNPERQKSPYTQIDVQRFNLERLRRVQPDLIIGTDKDEHVADELRGIAPLHLLAYKQYSWREHLRLLAAMIGIEETAVRWLTHYDLKAAAAQRRISRNLRQETVLAARVMQQGVRVFGTKRRKLSMFLYGDLGLQAPPAAHMFAMADLASLDELMQFQADHILLFHERGRSWSDATPLRGHVHHAGVYPWFHYSAYGHERALQEALVHFSG